MTAKLLLAVLLRLSAAIQAAPQTVPNTMSAESPVPASEECAQW